MYINEQAYIQSLLYISFLFYSDIQKETLPVHIQIQTVINTWGWSSLSILAGLNQWTKLQYQLIKQLAI